MEEKQLDEMNATGTVLRHKKRRRIFAVSCEDENKVFSMLDSVPRMMTIPELRIFWNTVLCAAPGKFLVKDPVLEAGKGS